MINTEVGHSASASYSLLVACLYASEEGLSRRGGELVTSGSGAKGSYN